MGANECEKRTDHHGKAEVEMHVHGVTGKIFSSHEKVAKQGGNNS